MRLSTLALENAPPVNTVSVPTGDRYALYAMISALGVALIYGIFNVLINRTTRDTAHSISRKIIREHELWLQWLLYNNFDPRKIRTGFEGIDEVRHAQT